MAANVVFIPDGCASLGSRAFADCTALEQIRIPENCALNEQVFDGCGTVCVYAPDNSPADACCAGSDHLIFVPWEE